MLLRARRLRMEASVAGMLGRLETNGDGRLGRCDFLVRRQVLLVGLYLFLNRPSLFHLLVRRTIFGRQMKKKKKYGY